jgi:hypothetical protein
MHGVISYHVQLVNNYYVYCTVIGKIIAVCFVLNARSKECHNNYYVRLTSCTFLILGEQMDY